MGPTISHWAGQHSCRAYGGGAHSEKRIVGGSGHLRSHGDAITRDRQERHRSYGLAIVGYGKMGRLIEQLAPEYGFEVRAKFDGRSNSLGKALSHETLRGVDAAVEFTSPEAAFENIRRLAVLALNPVPRTTG